jgi:hypothetical protein
MAEQSAVPMLRAVKWGVKARAYPIPLIRATPLKTNPKTAQNRNFFIDRQVGGSLLA